MNKNLRAEIHAMQTHNLTVSVSKDALEFAWQTLCSFLNYYEKVKKTSNIDEPDYVECQAKITKLTSALETIEELKIEMEE